MRRFGEHATGFCSGWMRVRGDRRRRGYDRGFVISDHADWPALLDTCRCTGARRVLLMHGHTDPLTRYLNEQGIEASALQTHFGVDRTDGHGDAGLRDEED
jgi:putative mRNA 3-end processing factor